MASAKQSPRDRAIGKVRVVYAMGGATLPEKVKDWDDKAQSDLDWFIREEIKDEQKKPYKERFKKSDEGFTKVVSIASRLKDKVRQIK